MVMKVIGVIVGVCVCVLLAVYLLILRYPRLKKNPKIGKWYRLENGRMKSSRGREYHALFRKGKENKVMVYFAGGGVSVNEQTARNDTYNTKLVRPDLLANITMNMGGLATATDKNPFKDWSMILFPYATGDFHCGTGEFKYTNKKGKQKILYHNGYVNFTEAMKLVMEYAGISEADTVLVTGYSAGGWGASLLADDVFSNYFPNAASKTVFVDSSLALNKEWKRAAADVWKAPKHICDRLVSDNITLDTLTALHRKHGERVSILFGSSTRDGCLAQVQRYFKDGIIDEETGKMPVDEVDGDIYQQTLKETISKFKKQAGAYLFIWDGFPWYDDPRNLTSHTIISVSQSFEKLNESNCSIAEWVMDAINRHPMDYGLKLLEKQYARTE